MKRTKHSLSHYKLLTCKMGELVPVSLVETLPGDTIQQSTSLLLRMSPMLAPVMHPVSVRVHHWFVPTRLLWDDWEDFITGGSDGLGAATAYPTYGAPLTVSVGDLYDYLGVPTGIALPTDTLSLLPLRAYNLIYNEWYRDQDLISEVSQDAGAVQKVAWDKDYFTTARPWAQKGPSVTLPLGTTATVTGTISGNGAPTFDVDDATGVTLGANLASINADWSTAPSNPDPTAVWNDPKLVFGSGVADLSGATAADVSAVRRAFAIQRYQEARAQYGSRYTEYLRYLGIRSSDARLQRPEYLGGGKQTVAFSEVLRTGSLSDESSKMVGEMKGHGIAALRSNRYRYFCEEHGYILTLLSVRPRSMYMNGLEKTFARRTKEDYFQKELELIGQQEVLNQELYAGTVDATNKATFGYQDRYAEYRHKYSSVSGDFRSTLNHWHLARSFGSLPTLNQSFVECDPSARIFAEQTQDHCWVMASHSIQARRMVGKKTIGRVI